MGESTFLCRETPPDSPAPNSDNEYYYFCYGPVVDDLVRKRRDLRVEHLQAAFLPDYRLTFAIGGLANIVPRTGYEVHGLLMKLASAEDWERLLSFDAGSTPSFHNVIPYKYDNRNCRREGDPRTEGEPILARFVEFSGEVEDEFLDSPIETLPQCRYLELIATGMAKYGVDEDYIDCQIMGTPFEPKRPPEEYREVPLDCNHLASTSTMSNLLPLKMRRKTSREKAPPGLPRLSYSKYLQLCERHNAEQPTAAGGGDVYFIVDNYVYRIAEPDITKTPMAKWLFRNGHGKPDVSLIIHKLIVDHDIPICDRLEEFTPLHFAWVENHIVEQLLEMYHCDCKKVAKIADPSEEAEESRSSLSSTKSRSSQTSQSSISSRSRSISRKMSRLRSFSPKSVLRKSRSFGSISMVKNKLNFGEGIGAGSVH